MKKEDILEILPEISDEQFDALSLFFENELASAFPAISEEEIENIRKSEYDKGYLEASQLFHKAEFERLLSCELLANDAKNIKAVSALLDLDKLELQDGKLIGFDEQIAAIKEECPYLFDSIVEKPVFTKGINDSNENIDLYKLSYKERLKLFKEMPELYNILSR